MSKGVNKVILIGNLGNEPEQRQAPSGDAIATLSVATSERWTDKQSGQPVERTEWHRVVAFARLAEICCQYLHKGSKVYIEGQLRTRKWQDQGGADRYTTEIVARDMQMLDSGPAARGDAGGQGAAAPQPRQPQPRQRAAPKPRQPGFADDEPFNDDVPF